ncbi:MAG: Tol-Pal system beta propeller repeat protein TolB [gamma proteobacterium symbiont of Bathyaustriella thionipta]|nr:Tol-Pal system beta propeller repeat protein TolB [gamma proteobacterium symbiont of Bathyaustriella thionipta]
MLLLSLLPVTDALAELTIDITQGAEGATPIAVVPFGAPAGLQLPQDVAAIISTDLRRSGRFKPLAKSRMISQPHDATQIAYREWQALGMNHLLVGKVSPDGTNSYRIRFQLFDVYKREQLTGFTITTSRENLRASAHHIADIVYEALTGEKGAFDTRIAYITEDRSNNKRTLTLNVADSDGYNPQVIVTSKEPLMSPAWSPDGRKIAYVSFEKGKPAIFVQEVFTGKRSKISSFKGINGAPAWSPDGKRLALTLSRDGDANIYIMDLVSRRLQKLTSHYAIDTEPAWSPDGKHIVFTSSRGGQPQLYRKAVSGGKAERLTFEGKYNARGSYSPDGKSLLLVTRVNGDYRIAVLDLQQGDMRVLSDGRFDESPSFAPNGRMIIYGTRSGRKGELAEVSVDGSVRQRLSLQQSNVREPVWSPYNRRQ